MLPTLAWETYRNHRIEICPDPDSEDPLCEGVSRRRHRVVPIARGEEATRLWQQPLDEETLIKLASAHVAN